MIAPTGGDQFVGHIVLDIPAENPIFNFQKMASALAGTINASEPRFAVGIFGGWGSGKSTLMHAIRQQVNPAEAVVVEFNAWRYEQEPHLIVPLLDTIRDGLSKWAKSYPNDVRSKEIKSVAARIGRVIQALVRATKFEVGLPGAVKVSVEPEKALDALNEGDSDETTMPQSLYYAAFQQLDIAFREVHDAGLSRIVVFVDDLDRCLPERALTVLESMKLFFDTAGFIFVVGLDERVVQSAVRTKFALQPEEELDTDRQVEGEYLNKIFQLGYSLPRIAPAQLDQLVGWLDSNAALSDWQRTDLNGRVKDYLRYVAKEGRINPREVKRYINAYTLQRIIRPELVADTTLALQTMDFRTDWERFYEQVVLAEPDVFPGILQSFRNGEDSAFEDVWPDVGVLPMELSEFLRSDLAQSLSYAHDLELYITSLETTRSTKSGVPDAMNNVGLLRRQLRDNVPDSLQFESPGARTVVEQALSILGHLDSYAISSGSPAPRLTSLLQKLTDQYQLLVAPQRVPMDPATSQERPADRMQTWKKQTADHIDALQQELRLIRRSSAVGPR
ncbi:KAP family P-loop domain protein (plasmid) [Mycobacterium sp. JS623]|uniref:KAP family P-loop NTPase fold protein n=1 Tax=Mycobacterium sp. JS623 TaxID=212767 RepID=UPI0002A57F49|nr:P-loop NTPase fold protein [Mycobacterium sp. JS623]AGB26860.1 KAP family P-loop domain protein [Mycobacterium sp. JS623]